MERRTEIPDFRIRLTDRAISSLLGITLTEYLLLSHRPIEAFTDMYGEITEFYIHVSSNNHPDVLKKLKMDSSNFVRFEPEEVYNRFI